MRLNFKPLVYISRIRLPRCSFVNIVRNSTLPDVLYELAHVLRDLLFQAAKDNEQVGTAGRIYKHYGAGATLKVFDSKTSP